MLKLKKRLSLSLPSLFVAQPMLSPAAAEDDELIREIDNQAEIHDDAWTLESTPDSQQLERAWAEMSRDAEYEREFSDISID